MIRTSEKKRNEWEFYQRQRGRTFPPRYSIADGFPQLTEYNATERAICMVVADGDARYSEYLYNEVEFSEVYELYARVLAYRYEPFHPPE